MKLVYFFRPFLWAFMSISEMLIRLIVAIILSGVIGYEREYRHKPSGMRTNMLVGLGTALITIVSLEIIRQEGATSATDISRIISSVLPGIGFIGAGMIIQSRGHVQGLTTAASLWLVAGIGIAAGVGMFSLAAIATVIGLVTLVFLRAVRVEDSEENTAPR